MYFRDNLVNKVFGYRRYFLITILFFTGVEGHAWASASFLFPHELKVNGLVEPVGVNVEKIQFGWKSESTTRGSMQTAYQVQVVSADADFGTSDLLWDSGQVFSDQSLYINYEGNDLTSNQKLKWRIRVWDQGDNVSEWSAPSTWTMGLLNHDDWLADWISFAGENAGDDSRVTAFKYVTKTHKPVTRVIAHFSSLGIYEVTINGQKVGTDFLTPGWTSYKHRVQYQSYEITELFANPEITIMANVADGWFRGYLGWENNKAIYGKSTAFIAQFHIFYQDGTEQIIKTDDNWQATQQGPFLAADIYKGEIYDSTRPFSEWSSVRIAKPDIQKVAMVAPAVREVENIQPVSIRRLDDGGILADFGQNFVGWVSVTSEEQAGTTMQLQHAEVLAPNGDIYTENLRTATQEDKFTFSGNGLETYQPRFTFHGFRYLKINGLSSNPESIRVVGKVVHSDLKETGSWESSSALLNQLYQNIKWGQKSNFLDIPTDCPQRDERMGWTGDAQVFSATAAINMDVSNFFSKWLVDLSLDQYPDGRVPHVVPDVLSYGNSGTAGWADAATVIPWNMYLAYGDKGLLEQQFTSMKKWVDFALSAADDDFIWRPGFQYGDWLAPLLNDQFTPYRAETGTDLIATAYLAHSANIVAKTAKILGDATGYEKYSSLFDSVKEAFNREFVTETGQLLYSTQTAYVLALDFDLLPDNKKSLAARHIADDVVSRYNHLTTGFLGTPSLNKVLSDSHYTTLAYRLLNQTTYPSWLYPVTHGATTIWERWDAVRSDGSYQDPEMTSFNHYAYGAIGGWMMTTAAGIQIDSDNPGYKHVIFNPVPGGGLTYAKGEIETPYGNVKSSWRLTGKRFEYSVQVAANTMATVILPYSSGSEILESNMLLARENGIRSILVKNDATHVEVGAGEYTFSYESENLALQANDYQKLDARTPLFELSLSPETASAIRELAPSLLSSWSMRTLGDKSLREIRAQFGNPDAIDELMLRLPEIDDKRRALIFKLQGEH